uniref:Ubiquitin-like protease family profile domain-containing protein n=1 Tax=Arundo donax TaxID=35708 RepID=A0A0A8XWH1_ARUDO
MEMHTCIVSIMDFLGFATCLLMTLIMSEIDRKSDGFHSHYYGVRDFRDISYTPYRTLQPLRPEPSQNMYHNDVQKIVNKQKALWKDDLPCIVHTLQDIFENRLTSIASDFNALYMSKIEELSSNGGSGPSVSAVAAPSVPATLIVPSSSNVEQQAAIDDPIGVKDKSATIDDPVEDSASGDVHSSPSNSDSGTSADEKTPPIDTSNIEHSVSNMNISANDCLADGSADTSHIASAIPATNLDSAFKSVDDLDTEIGIAMSYASPIHETETVNIDEVPSLGPSTIDLKNRKKRKATVPNAPCEPLVVQVDDEIQDFYTTYVQKKSLAASKMPYFVKHQDFHLTYEEFQKPLKQRSKLSDALMAVYVNVFNGKPEKYVFDESECKKICFSPSFGKKMLIKPQLFQTRCCIGELRKAHNLLKINTADLIFFPILVQEHWVLICINVLYGTLNFFDSANITSDEDKERMLRNVATNFSKVCPEAGVSKDGFEGYRTDCTTTYPMQTTLHDCG